MAKTTRKIGNSSATGYPAFFTPMAMLTAAPISQRGGTPASPDGTRGTAHHPKIRRRRRQQGIEADGDDDRGVHGRRRLARLADVEPSDLSIGESQNRK
jgi:hypothetical protein